MRAESNECFTEDHKCKFEDFAERAENEFGKKPFGFKSWRKRTPDEASVGFFEENYTNCDSTELNYGCKERIHGYLNCAKDPGARHGDCAEENQKVEVVKKDEGALIVDHVDVRHKTELVFSDGPGSRGGRVGGDQPESKSLEKSWKVNTDFATPVPDWLEYDPADY
jgi:hypothetical protein